jgi:hypothetical protein
MKRGTELQLGLGIGMGDVGAKPLFNESKAVGQTLAGDLSTVRVG